MGSTRERNPSLWIATSTATSYEHLAADTRADAVVVGAGITGMTTARLLASAGMAVVVIDAGELCAGVTGYTTAKVTSLLDLRTSPMARPIRETVSLSPRPRP